MIALHLSFLHGAPFLWGESAGDKNRAAGKYPFDPGAGGIGQALRQAAPGFAAGGKAESGTVWLPSRGGVPEFSSPVFGPPPDGRRKAVLAPFRTTVHPLSVEDLFELTPRAVEPPAGSGVIFGPSFLWTVRLIEAAFEFVLREAFLPGVVATGETWEARWIPVPDEGLEQRLAELAAGMPGSCRCLGDDPQAPPDLPPALVAGRLLARCLDEIVRRATAASEDAGRKRDRRSVSSLHDAWLAALASPDGVIPWPVEKDLRDLATRLGDWQRPVDLTIRSPFRFCFRLEEPGEETESPDDWRVEYLLQSKADPSLLAPVSELWTGKGGAGRQLEKIGGKPTEFILTALGQAAGLSAGVAASLKNRHPGGFVLDAQGAFDFLREEAQALRGAGFTVLLPSWWVGRGPVRRLGLKARVSSPKMQGSGGLTLEAMVDFDLSASLGGEEISLRELRELARLKAPLVKVRGQWTQIDQSQLQTALRFLEKHGGQILSARDLLGLALGGERDFGGLSVEAVETDGWLRELLDRLTGREDFALVPAPERFAGELRPYQQRGLSWLAFLRRWGLGACLADDMGLGKTVQTLALIQRERESGENRPVLLVCPTTVANNWRKEAQKFTPDLPVMIHHGADRRRKDFAAAAQGCALVVTSYGLLHRDAEMLQEVGWSGVILDEAQNIKNPQTLQFKAARALRADYRIALTGTPVENHVGDLWALMEFLNPGLLGAQSAFRQNFYRPIQIWRDAGRSERLKTLTSPFMLRRLKTDKTIIGDLPEKIETKEFCTLTREQASLYAAVIDDLQERLETAEGMERRGLVLATLSKLKQVCNHPAHFVGDGSALAGRSGKLARLEEMLAEIRQSGERTLLFTQYAEMGSLLQSHFQERFGEEVFFLHGGTARKRRDEMVERFQNDPRAPHLFILSLKAGGTGLTLTRANHVVHYDRWWNPAVEDQATDRAFRIGQKRNVQVHKLLVAGTLEERIDEMIERKTGIAAQVVGAGEQWLTELSNDDLRELIRLGAEAVGD